MAREREIKVRLKGVSLDEFVKRIEKSQFKLVKAIEQEDIYFDNKDWWLYDNLAALRWRKVNGKDHSFSFKKMFYIPHKEDKHFIEEVESKFPLENEAIKDIMKALNVEGNPDISSGEALASFFRDKGFLDEQKMPKTRRVYKRGDDEVVIDDVDKVGVIIEIERQEGEPMELAKEFLADNEWERDLEGTSYIWLRKVKGLDRHLGHLKRFEEIPDWNVWEWEKDYYKNISE